MVASVKITTATMKMGMILLMSFATTFIRYSQIVDDERNSLSHVSAVMCIAPQVVE